jgi:chemotaxis protein CheY-P-specific phosphatase CheC
MTDARRKAEIDRLAELASVGARHAAAAFAQLVGEPIRVEVPFVVEAGTSTHRGDPQANSGDRVLPGAEGKRAPDVRRAPSSPRGEGLEWVTGVFFEFEGCLDAIVGILFPGASSERLVRRIVGIEAGELAPPLIESALMEVGNILASHVASAIADALQERLLPSIPSLAMKDAERAFETWIADRVGADAPRVESELHDDRFELCGRLVLVPTR